MPVQLCSEDWLPETADKARKRPFVTASQEETIRDGSCICQPLLLFNNIYIYILLTSPV